ncbi:MAG: tetratricopeptide repeat protein [Acidobacteriota bacterium]
MEGRYADARTLSLKALREAEQNGSGRERVGAVLDELGTTEYLDGRYKAALRYFERLVELWDGISSEKAVALSNLGQTLLALGETTRAEKVLRQSIEISAKAGRPWHVLGQVLYMTGRMGESEEAQREALQLADPGDSVLIASTRNDLAAVYERAGRYGESIELLEQAITVSEPGQARARMTASLGSTHWKAGHKEQALELLRQAKDEMEAAVGQGHEDTERIVLTYAEVLREMGRKKEAKAVEAGLARGLR